MKGSLRVFHIEEEQLVRQLLGSRFVRSLPWERRAMMPVAFILVYTSALVVLVMRVVFIYIGLA